MDFELEDRLTMRSRGSDPTISRATVSNTDAASWVAASKSTMERNNCTFQKTFANSQPLPENAESQENAESPPAEGKGRKSAGRGLLPFISVPNLLALANGEQLPQRRDYAAKTQEENFGFNVFTSFSVGISTEDSSQTVKKLRQVFQTVDLLDIGEDEDKTSKKTAQKRKIRMKKPFNRLEPAQQQKILKFVESICEVKNKCKTLSWAQIWYKYMRDEYMKSANTNISAEEREGIHVLLQDRIRKCDEILSSYVESTMGDVGMVGERASLAVAWDFLHFLRSHKIDPYSCVIGKELHHDAVLKVVNSKTKPYPGTEDKYTKEELIIAVLKLSSIENRETLFNAVSLLSSEFRGFNKLKHGDVVAIQEKNKYVFGRLASEIKQEGALISLCPLEEPKWFSKSSIYPLPSSLYEEMVRFKRPTEFASVVQNPAENIHNKAMSDLQNHLYEKIQSQGGNPHLFNLEKENITILHLVPIRKLKSLVEEMKKNPNEELFKNISEQLRSNALSTIKNLPEQEIFLPQFANNIQQIASFPFRSLIDLTLNQWVANCEEQEELVGAMQEKLFTGTTKRALTEWWLEHITDSSMKFLCKLGYDVNAYPDNYTNEKPDSFEGVTKNTAILQQVLNPKEDVYNVQLLMESLKKTIYPRIDEYLSFCKISLCDKLGMLNLDFDIVKFSLNDARARFAELKQSLTPEVIYSCSETIKDIEYLERMKSLEESKRKTKTLDVVPITGLVIGLFCRLENECKTVLELWRPSTKGNVQDRPKLHTAIASENTETVEELLQKEDIATILEERDENGWTALHTASVAATTFPRLAICEMLLLKWNSLNLDVNVQNSDGNTPLHFIVRVTVCDERIQSRQIDILGLMLKRDPDVNMMNKEGESPLHAACFHGNITAARQLLHKGANPNLQTKSGQSCLHCATRRNMPALVKILVPTADRSLKDKEGYTAKDYATMMKNSEIEDLLTSGVVPRQKWLKQERRSSFAEISQNLVLPSSKSGWRRMAPTKDKSQVVNRFLDRVIRSPSTEEQPTEPE